MRERLFKWLSDALGPEEDIQITSEDDVWPEDGLVNAPDFDEATHSPTCHVLVSVGDQVAAGEVLLELEMSMYIYELVSPCSGVVEELYVTGNPIAPEQALVKLTRPGQRVLE
ncbi:acetyl-CoA carboxylase biotin carboxyl carrier protein subunit [Pseudoteredinibacter isoporae]|uniref:acetyl-CoA carboxylase biotin carboxyl carrier protein subunit n=1 Tax=Pseudoteredinibacter isoporae TaxID=570281 RepID=UPI00310B0D90